MRHNFRYIPFVRNLKIRMAVGFGLLVLSVLLANAIFEKGRLPILLLITTFVWILAVFLTDKYVHKYPQRYFTYLIASHLKAAMVMGFFLLIIGWFAGPFAVPHDVLWTGYLFFVFADALVSLPCHRDVQGRKSSVASLSLSGRITEDRSSDPHCPDAGLYPIHKQAILRQIRSNLEKPLVEFIEKNLPDLQGVAGDVLVIDDINPKEHQAKSAPVGLLVGSTRINDVRRLNQFLLFCVKRITVGGYFVARYVPLENVIKNLRRRYTGLPYWRAFILHFIWYRAIPKIPCLDTLYFSPMLSWLDTLYFSVTKKRNRALPKAEVWGRLSYCGMEVIGESKGEGEVFLIAKRVASPVQGKKTSYYPIVALAKVGLDGEIIHTHKIRTMFPFSEFLQKRIFEEHGLTSTGKFSNDFRLTELGRFLRRYWLDELPQIFDWLHGDVKLVGMRATSAHFLSLYPEIFLDLYLQTKPGLIPPIFDDSIKGFDQIVEVELTYLQRYRDKPIRTDIRYLTQTFVDILFKGVRSR